VRGGGNLLLAIAVFTPSVNRNRAYAVIITKITCAKKQVLLDSHVSFDPRSVDATPNITTNESQIKYTKNLLATIKTTEYAGGQS
jgi:hypothetical protein